MKASTLSRIESKFRPLIGLLPSSFVVKRYSNGRTKFLKRFQEDVPWQMYVPEGWKRKLWGIEFRSSIFNAAGMFKNGESYPVVAAQGAGAYLGGTGTWNEREGNTIGKVHLPFAPYPLSGAASNKLGLPNLGDMANAFNARDICQERIPGCPVGWSVMGSPDYQGVERVVSLVHGMDMYANAGVDFIEQNGSCPNVAHDGGLILRDELRHVGTHFIRRRDEMGVRKVPVIYKASNDTREDEVPHLLDMLFKFGYSGVNFGNTSTDYARHRSSIHPRERKLYDYFTKTFGGGVSGTPLKHISLQLASAAVRHIEKNRPPQEFHVIRTGGIDCLEDLRMSEDAGIALNQWFTGYFENFAKHGHRVYEQMFVDVA